MDLYHGEESQKKAVFSIAKTYLELNYKISTLREDDNFNFAKS